MALQRYYIVISSDATQTPKEILFINWVGEHDASSTVSGHFLIYNCYICFNGNKFTKFSDLPPPSLADYLEN